MEGQTRRNRWVDRLLVVLMALSPFLLLEAGLWVFGYRGLVDNPYRGFVGHVPIFLRDGDRLRADPDRKDVVGNQPTFTARKAPGTLRIFCVGDSTTWGWSGNEDIEGYPSKLLRMLKERFPGRSFEVVNCGVVRFASYRLLGVVREIMAYDPDVITLLTGSSEFLEARSYREWKERLARKTSWMRHVKSLSLLRDLLAGIKDEGREGQDLAERDGYLRADFIKEEFIVRDPAEIQATLDHSAHNVATILEICRAGGVPLFLLTSPSNLRFPPHVVHEGYGGSAPAHDRLILHSQRLTKAGRSREAIDLLNPAIAKDPRSAALQYRLGEAWDALGNHERAARAYLAAKDRDPFPHRAVSRFIEDVRRLAEGNGVFLVDLVKAFFEAVPDGIPDQRLFHDNCHPHPVGHELIAQELFEALIESGVVDAD